MINPNAYECIYISKANFDSVELLLLSARKKTQVL